MQCAIHLLAAGILSDVLPVEKKAFLLDLFNSDYVITWLQAQVLVTDLFLKEEQGAAERYLVDGADRRN